MKYEIVDGVMSVADAIPFRLQLNSYLFTPHYNSPITNIDNTLTIQINISVYITAIYSNLVLSTD